MLPISLPAYADEPSHDSFCRVIEKYAKPRGTEYEPGIDVRGRAVVPADLGQGGGQGAALQNFESVQIPVTIDLAQKFNIPPRAGVELKPDVALVSIHMDGRVMYNGQEIGSQARILCEESHESKSRSEIR